MDLCDVYYHYLPTEVQMRQPEVVFAQDPGRPLMHLDMTNWSTAKYLLDLSIRCDIHVLNY